MPTAVPNPVIITDQIKDGYSKVNLGFQHIITAVTYTSNTLSLFKVGGDVITTTLNNTRDLLVNATKIVSASGTINWSTPFTASTFNEIYHYVFGVPYTIDMASDAGKYIELTIDGTVSGTYDQNRFYKISLYDRGVDGDSLFLKINSNHNSPSLISSRTENTIVGNNSIYLFTYTTGTTSWKVNLMEKANYTQLVDNSGYYNTFVFTSYTTNLLTTSSTLTATNATPPVLQLEQSGKYVINFNYSSSAANIWLPSANTFTNQEIEIIDITKPNSYSNYSLNKKTIYTRYGQKIYTLGTSVELPYFSLNEQNSKKVKFISNGFDWVLVEPFDLFRTPIGITPRFASTSSPSSSFYTAQTTTSNGSFRFMDNTVFYNFEYKGKVVTNQPSSSVMVMLPFEASTDSNQISGFKNAILMTSAGTLSIDADVQYNGGTIPSNLRFIKTNFPSKTYYTWSDIGNETFIIKGNIEYGVVQTGGNTFYMDLNSSDIEARYSGYYF